MVGRKNELADHSNHMVADGSVHHSADERTNTSTPQQQSMNSALGLTLTPKLAAGYVRCSTEHQEDSPEQQKMAIGAFAKEQGYTILEWFEDFGKSGTTFRQRPGFMRLKDVVDGSPNFSYVICYDESRWGRAIDPEEHSFWRVYFRNAGVNILLVKTSVDHNNEFAPMLASFEGVLASQQSKTISRLTLRGSLNNKKYSNGGTAPYGFIRIATNQKTGTERPLQQGEWCISGQEKVSWGIGDDGEVGVVRFIFAERAKGIATVLIAKALNDRNVPTARRGKWRTKDQRWSAVTIKSIIENPAYYGTRVYNRNSMSKIIAKQRLRRLESLTRYPHWRNPKTEWTVTEGAHPAIVSRDLWEKANEIRSRVKARSGNRFTYGSRYLLTGLVYCSRCGFAFQGMTSKCKGKIYPKYVDGGWKNKRVCSHLGICQDILDRFAIESIKQTISSPELFSAVSRSVAEILDQVPYHRSNERERLQQCIQSHEVRIQKLLEALESGGAERRITTRIEELEREQQSWKCQLSQVDKSGPPLISPEVIRRRVTDFFDDFSTRFDQAPIEERRVMVRKMISRIEVDRDNNIVRFFVRKLPTILPELEEWEQKERVAAGVATTQSSGGRT